MKELTIEEKAQRYDEALKIAKDNYDMVIQYNKECSFAKEAIVNTFHHMFPELKESEDEKIRKNIKIALMSMEDNLADFYSTHRTSQKELLAWLEKQSEQKEYTFKSLPRLLDMIEPTNKAKAYCQKLIDSLIEEGYSTDAKIVGECLKQMNGEDVPMAVMDENKGEQKPTDMDKIKEKAHQIAWENSKHYDPTLSKESWCEMAALEMAYWLEKQHV